MATQTLKQKVDAIPYWYHKIDLPEGVTTPGWAPLQAKSYHIPDSLSDQRILDIGAWDGYWSFEALKRGAREVVAIDDFSDFLGSLQQSDRRAWDSFDLCRKALGYNDQNCKRLEMDLYALHPDTLGTFSTVFFFDALYHLRYPLLALDKIASVCTGHLFLESAILDNYSPYKGGMGKGYPGNQVLMEFYPGKEYGNNDTNWWCPTLTCLMAMVHAAGFKQVEGWKLMEDPNQLPLCRGFVRATK